MIMAVTGNAKREGFYGERGLFGGRRIGHQFGVIGVGFDEPDLSIFKVGQQAGVLGWVKFASP